MKTSSEYLAAHVFEARRPRRDLQPVVAYTDAVHALDQALADAEKYRYLLMRALRRHDAATAAPASAAATPSFFADEATVLPFFPAQARQAA